MKITREDVLKVAQIAHLSLSEDEVDAYTQDLEKMLVFASELNNIEGIDEPLEEEEPTLYNVFRKDEVQPSMAKEELLANAPKAKNGCFFVPQTVE